MKILSNKLRAILIVTTLILSILLINQTQYRNDELYAVNLKNKMDKNLVSILVSDESGNYNQYESETFPSKEDYTYNSELSKCQDNNGNVIEGILSYDETTGKVRIRTKKTTYCYLYFDKTAFAEELIASGKLWQSGLEEDGYRYTGSDKATTNTTPNNFICFGTNNLSECKANESKYMYRIIGVFPDEEGNQHLKLIKYKQLGKYKWHSDREVAVSWEESDLYKGLNGISGGSYSNLFIGNTSYNYLQNEIWLNKIVDWKWTATNTDLMYRGPVYKSITTKEVYLHEMKRSTRANTKGGEWTYPIAKIGLMYASDYQMSLGNSSLTMISENDYEILKTGWLHPDNNDSTTDSNGWFITRGGWNGGPIGMAYYLAYYVSSTGNTLYDNTNLEISATPVFYLDSNVTTFDGNGEYNTPYLINS